ncbi:hypothetical protein [Bacillus massiliigorillae]|uniref:cation transporter dimerization domain-containing protein n=1 Tax=Bacillus massiliigorillae TaxID=1243664 RepID=UPI0003AA5D3C|nr:hypothetical protein [Bacillus massiliigorillae]
MLKQLKALTLTVGLALVLSACGGGEEEKKETTPKQENVKETANMTDKLDVTKSDEDMKKEIAKEKGVSQISLIVTEDSGKMVLLDFEVSADMKKEQAKAIAEKYGKKLKEKYKEYKIDIQVKQGGTKLEQVKL